MNEHKFYYFLHIQILLLIVWSLLTGLGYTILCYVFDMAPFTLIWFGAIIAVSAWGWELYRQFKYVTINKKKLKKWYQYVQLFIYSIFGLWTVLFILYSDITEHNLNQVTVLIQVTASILAATFLFSDKKLFIPVLLILIYPLVVYFINLDETKGYFLAFFTLALLGFLLYASNNGYKLIQQIFHQAQQDSLTGLYNRRHFMENLDQLLKTLKESKKFSFILLIDLDHFKNINDTLGHDVGDKLLCEISNRLNTFCGDSKHVARLGGDEFMITSYPYDNYDECLKSADIFSHEIGRLLKEMYVIDFNHIHISVSIGVKLLDSTLSNSIQVVKEADIAMYEVKSSGRDGVVNFNKALSSKISNTLEMERKLYFALEHDEIELYYQPQVNKDGLICGCEVLTRWYNPDLGMVAPLEFIKIAEKTGLIIDLGNYILEESFKSLQTWEKKEHSLEQLSINISVKQLLHESFIKRIEYLFNKYLSEKSQHKIVFEITETLLAEDIHNVISIMKKVKNLGIQFSLDDFGTGYSSLNYVREIPIDELKIDKSFVRTLGENKSDEMMLKTIFTLADIFNLRVVAEGIETDTQFEILKAHNCNLFQGYYFDKPLKKDDFEIKLFKQKVKKVKIEMGKKKILNKKHIG
ncbi:MAG: EAL domain-containing protein [Sulfurovum sp.]|nr:EAL domain-containing protein [Sulfurovum sp.]